MRGSCLATTIERTVTKAKLDWLTYTLSYLSISSCCFCLFTITLTNHMPLL